MNLLRILVLNNKIMDNSPSFKFRRYCDIENNNNPKNISKILEFDKTHDTGIWVALEKVHGCNFSFLIMKDEKGKFKIKIAKRTSIIEEGEELNNININKLVGKYSGKLKEAFEMVENMSYSQSIKQLTIFGELFGGHYPHPSVPKFPGAKLCQTGVYYHNDNDFYAFDIHNGEKYLDYDVCMKIFEKCGFFYAAPLFSGKIKDAMEFPNTFETTIPSHYGHPSLGESNIAEGLVLKPMKNWYMPNGKRLILKNKTVTYSEVDKKKTKKVMEDLDTIDKIWNEVESYITVNRLHNVQSHGNYHGKMLIGPLSNDVMKEFLRDEDEEITKLYRNLSDKQRKIFKKRLSNGCMKIVMKNLEE